MTGLETAAAVIATLNNPLVQLGLAGALAAGSVLAGYLIQTQPKVAEVAQDLADLDAEIGPWVAQAERLLAPGTTKYSEVEGKARDWLAARGIVGRKGRLVQKYLPALIEKAVALQPQPPYQKKAG
jgi:hypothetical protein